MSQNFPASVNFDTCLRSKDASEAENNHKLSYHNNSYYVLCVKPLLLLNSIRKCVQDPISECLIKTSELNELFENLKLKTLEREICGQLFDEPPKITGGT
jgi:hypothetical protein